MFQNLKINLIRLKLEQLLRILELLFWIREYLVRNLAVDANPNNAPRLRSIKRTFSDT